MSNDVRLTAFVTGQVQGVGFRDFVRRHAEDLGLRGRASNLDDGRVQVVAEGSRPALDELLDVLRGDTTPGRVADVATRWDDAQGLPAGFAAQ